MSADMRLLLVSAIVVAIFVLGVWFTTPADKPDVDDRSDWHKRRPR